MKKHNQKPETLKIFSIKEVFSYTQFKNQKRVDYFKKKGTVCVSCGCVGIHFALELFENGRMAINLYGINSDGVERLMTKDHIIPKSKDGSNDLKNLQTMCYECNSKKGNKILN